MLHSRRYGNTFDVTNVWSPLTITPLTGSLSDCCLCVCMCCALGLFPFWGKMFVQPPLSQFCGCRGTARAGRLGWLRWAWVYGVSEWNFPFSLSSRITCVQQTSASWIWRFIQIWFPLWKLVNQFFLLRTRWCMLHSGLGLWGARRRFVWCSEWTQEMHFSIL